MIEHIIVPLDTSPLAECVLPHAIALAQSFQADITLLHILESPRSAAESSIVDPFAWELHRAEARRYLDDVLARVRRAGLTTEALLMEGRAEESIVQLAQRYEQTCLVLSSQAQGGLSEWKIGSVTQKVMSRRHVTTMIVRACPPPEGDLQSSQYLRLLVPLDGSLRAECVLPVVTMLSNFHNAHVFLAHVLTRPEMPRGMLTLPEDRELADRLIEHMRVDALDYLVQMRARAGQNAEIRLLEGDSPADALHRFIEEEQIDLVVMSAHGHSGKADWPYGSLVTHFITHCATALLIVQDLPETPGSVQDESAHRDILTVRRLKD